MARDQVAGLHRYYLAYDFPGLAWVPEINNPDGRSYLGILKVLIVVLNPNYLPYSAHRACSHCVSQQGIRRVQSYPGLGQAG